MMRKQLLFAAAFLLGGMANAFATCTGPAVMHDFAGTAFNMSLGTNAGDGNCANNMAIIGTLPPFASTPTINLGTLNGAATAANQAAEIGSLATIATNSGLAVPLEALSSEQAKATTGNPVAAFGDLVGKLITSPYANRENMVRGAATATGTGATTVLAASGNASLKTYVTDVECGRDDAGTTAIHVTLNDVGGTGSGTQLIIPTGGGNNKHFGVPLVTAANTALTFTPSTGVSTLYCSAQGFVGY